MYKYCTKTRDHLRLSCNLCGCQNRSVCFGSFLFPRRGLSRKAPSNARGVDPFLGGFLFGFFIPARRGRSPQAAPGLGFSLVLSGGKPTFLFCGNLLSLDRENDCARSFVFPGWCVPSGSRSDRAGPGIGEGVLGMEILLRYRKGEYSHSISPSRDDSTSPGRNR